MRMPFVDAVVVAAGSSRRMAGIDKLDAVIGDRTVLQHAVEAVALSGLVARTVIVAAPDRVADMAARPWVRRGLQVPFPPRAQALGSGAGVAGPTTSAKPHSATSTR